ncbi:hypothetical protein GQ600_21452 [Phytophthora cactorum]|nr:hypothetical protein GQ600_21452 [Phytophthora cactorum]
MAWALQAALTVGLSAASAASSSTLDSPLQALEASPLFTLQQSVAPSLVWAEYERFLLSRSRTTPLLLYFTPASNCYGGESEDDEAEAEEKQRVESRAIDHDGCLRHQKLVKAAVELAAETLSTPQLPVIRVDVQAWPKMLDYHLMSTTPSLLWMPGRASGRFQRYPHVETNFLDLSANGSLFAGFVGEESEKSGDWQHNGVAKEAAAREITAFVRLCRERSGYLTRNARGSLSPTVPVDLGDNTFSGLELIPVLAFLAFIAFVVNENRDGADAPLLVRSLLGGHLRCAQRIIPLDHPPSSLVLLWPNARLRVRVPELAAAICTGRAGQWYLEFLAVTGSDEYLGRSANVKVSPGGEEVIRWSLLLVAISYMALYFTFLMKYRWLA